jgi:hypothetical protein
MTRFSGVAGFEILIETNKTIPDLIPTVFNGQSILSVPNTSPLPQTDPERGPPVPHPYKDSSPPQFPSILPFLLNLSAFRVPRSPTTSLNTQSPQFALFRAGNGRHDPQSWCCRF